MSARLVASLAVVALLLAAVGVRAAAQNDMSDADLSVEMASFDSLLADHDTAFVETEALIGVGRRGGRGGGGGGGRSWSPPPAPRWSPPARVWHAPARVHHVHRAVHHAPRHHHVVHRVVHHAPRRHHVVHRVHHHRVHHAPRHHHRVHHRVHRVHHHRVHRHHHRRAHRVHRHRVHRVRRRRGGRIRRGIRKLFGRRRRHRRRHHRRVRIGRRHRHGRRRHGRRHRGRRHRHRRVRIGRRHRHGRRRRHRRRHGRVHHHHHRGGRFLPAPVRVPKPPKNSKNPADFVPYVQSLYQSLLCRVGEPGGVQHWTTAMANGASAATIHAGFIGSAEYRGRGGKPCPSNHDWTPYVESLYRTLLCRHSEPAGLAGWVGQLKSGALNADQVRQGFLNSPEYKGRGGRACGGHGGAVGGGHVHRPAVGGAPVGGAPAPAVGHRPHSAAAAVAAAVAAGVPPAAAAAAVARTTGNPDAIKTSPEGYKNRFISDWGYAHDRQWVDVCGRGQRNDYGRWVGSHPHVWYSIALKDCEHQYSGRGEWILKGGRVERGPNFRSCECKRPEAVTRVWEAPKGAPFRAPPAEQTSYPNIRHRRQSIGETAHLFCPEGQTIALRDASFGAGAGIYSSEGALSRGSCHLDGSLDKIIGQCNGKDMCSIAVAVNTFGSDPCPSNARKELQVTWSCFEKGKPLPKIKQPEPVQTPYRGIKMVEADDGDDAPLQCDGSEVINLLDATYGAHPGLYASNGFIRKGDCHASNSVEIVRAKCHGKSECAVKADAKAFPMTCTSTSKKLKITFRCAKAAGTFVAPVAPGPREWTKIESEPAVVKPQPADPSKADQVVSIGNSEVHIHVTQLSAPEPNAKALNYVETKLDRLHDTAMNKIENILDDIEEHRKEKKPCLKKLQATITKFKEAFVKEAQNVEKITHKFSYADDAPTLV